MLESVKNVLIYRLGSLGDTLLALPALHVIRRRFPRAGITALTNRPVQLKAPPLLAVVENSNLINDAIDYPLGLRGFRELARLRNEIASRRFDVAVNLAASRGWGKSLRDYWFLRSCGIPHVVGTPWRKADLHSRQDPRSDLYEWEGLRLVRRVRALGHVNLSDPAMWDLHLTAAEQRQATDVLSGAGIAAGFLAISVGTKVDVKDWTESNWSNLILQLTKAYPTLPLVAVGSEDEADRTTRCLAKWAGPRVNLCGRIPVRVVAAVLSRARIFVGHDSGPMHLAATVGIPCVAIFAARNLPGQWYPRGYRNIVLYNKTPCFGCELELCPIHQKKCILGIRVNDVASAVHGLLPVLNSAEPAVS